MKRIRMVMLPVMMLCCICTKVIGGELITNRVETHVDKAGTLSQMIGDSKKYVIINLKLTGEINGDDIEMIREMAGSGLSEHGSDGKLSVLDLSEVRIVDGGLYYYYDMQLKKVCSVYSRNNVIGKYMFSGCKSLTNIILPETVIEIDEYAFAENNSLKDVKFGKNLSKIGKGAFENCSKIKSLKFWQKVESFGDEAFKGCTGLSSVTLMSSKPPLLGKDVFSENVEYRCHMYVLHDQYKVYWLSAWGDYFKNMSEMNSIDK